MKQELLNDFLVIGLMLLIICFVGFVRLSDPVTKVTHDFHVELNQGPADLQSAALTTELCTLGICVQINKPENCTVVNQQPQKRVQTYIVHVKRNRSEFTRPQDT